MKPVRVLFLPLVAVLALLVSACGSGNAKVPAGAVAEVNGTPISRSEVDDWLAQAKKSYQAQQRQFPKAGTADYQTIQSQTVAFLVQKAEWEQAASDLGIKLTSKDIDKGVSDYIKQQFGGSRKNFEKALKAQNFSEDKFRETIEVSVLSKKIYDKVTKDAKVTDGEALVYYNQNVASYQQIDFPKSEKLALQLWRRLKAGASFAALAKKYSADTQSASNGGKATFTRGQTVPEFDKAAFALDVGEMSEPVKSGTYGYFIIKALSKVKPGQNQQKASRAVQYILVKKTKTTPFSKAVGSIKASQLQQKKQQIMTDWVQNLTKKYKSKVSYATGFQPPEVPSTTAAQSQ